MARVGLVLRAQHRGARADRRDRLGDRVEPERIELVEVEARRGVGRRDRDAALLHGDRPGVDARVGPEHGDARLGRAEEDLPRERVAAAEARQERRMEAERRVVRAVDDLGGPGRWTIAGGGIGVTNAGRLSWAPGLGCSPTSWETAAPWGRKRAWRNGGSPRVSASAASGSGRAPAGGAYTPTTS